MREADNVTAVYLFGAILIILLAAVVLAPLVEGRHLDERPEGELSAVERKELAIEALRELEFEYQTGKVSEQEYLSLRERFGRQALAAREELGEPAAAPEGRCETCGAEAREGAKFCGRCGSRLVAAAQGEASDG